MTWKLLRVLMLGVVGYALVAPHFGCGSGGAGAGDKPTIDMSTPLKAPDAPSTEKVETIKRKKGR
jgi:hypothetical protein